MPRVVDHEQRSVAIVEAAWRVLVRDGVREVSVRNVAAEAGLAVGQLRRSFPSQARLLQGCLTLMAQRVAERIRAVPPAPDPVAHALAILSETLPLDEVRRVEMEVYLSLGMTSMSQPEVVATYAEIQQSLRGLCAGLVAQLAPGLDAQASTRAADHLHALVDGLALHLLLDLDPARAEGVLAAHLDALAMPWAEPDAHASPPGR